VLYGSCPPDGTGYSGIANAVVDYIGVGAIDSWLAGFVAGPPVLVAAFSTLLTGIGIEAAERMSDDTVQGLFVELAHNLSERRPVVWIVDDVHSASAECQRVMSLLARRAAESRILLVLCGRDFRNRDFYGEVRLLQFAEEMRLSPMPASDVVSLVAQKVSRPSLAEDLGGILSSSSRHSASSTRRERSPNFCAIPRVDENASTLRLRLQCAASYRRASVTCPRASDHCSTSLPSSDMSLIPISLVGRSGSPD
jgi:hypothetical protein